MPTKLAEEGNLVWSIRRTFLHVNQEYEPPGEPRVGIIKVMLQKTRIWFKNQFSPKPIFPPSEKVMKHTWLKELENEN
jgi:hypothetical protein